MRKRKLVYMLTILIVILVDVGMIMMWFFQPSQGLKIAMATVCILSTVLLLAECVCEIVIQAKRISRIKDVDELELDLPDLSVFDFDAQNKNNASEDKTASDEDTSDNL